VPLVDPFYHTVVAGQRLSVTLSRMTTSLTGATTSVPIKDLSTFHRNPRRGDVKAIAASLRAHGQYKPIVVNIGTHTGRQNEVLAGNHTLMAFRDLAEQHPDEGWDTMLVHWVDVDDDRANRIVLVDNRTSQLGGYDTDELLSLLNDMGDDLEGLSYTQADIDQLQRASDTTPKYSDKTEVPHYTPTDDPPDLSECMDVSRTLELEKAITKAKLPDDVTAFLLRAAQRHTVIDFHKVADYYASAPAEVQRLMEDQALVLIDFDHAIKKGYVRLTNALRDTLSKDLEEQPEEL